MEGRWEINRRDTYLPPPFYQMDSGKIMNDGTSDDSRSRALTTISSNGGNRETQLEFQWLDLQ